MKKRDYRKFRIQGPGLEADAGRHSAEAASVSPRPRPADADDFAAMREVVQRRYRKVLEDGRAVSGPDPDRRRQGAAVARPMRALESVGLGSVWWPWASRRRRSCCFPRDRDEPIALAAERSGAAARSSASATRRTGLP